MSATKHTPGPWRWQGEDYRAGWGWQMLVGPNGEGLIVGQDINGDCSPHLRAHRPVDPALCITGMAADGKPHVEPVHVFSEANARLIAAAPDLLEALRFFADPPTTDFVDWRQARDKARAAIAKAEGR